MKNIIFLDVDGVLNCQTFYDSDEFKNQSHIPYSEGHDFEYQKTQMSQWRIKLLNNLCEETDSAVVISASMRNSYTVEQLQELFNYCGGTFKILDKTGNTKSRIRGVEIHEWLVENSQKYFNVNYYDFYRYAIIDDDSDMLLQQQYNFFHVDNYSGLTPNTIYKIKRFFIHKTF